MLVAAALDGRLAAARGYIQADPDELATWFVSGYLAIQAAVRESTPAQRVPAAESSLSGLPVQPAPPPSPDAAMAEFRSLVREAVATELRAMYPPAVASPVQMAPYANGPMPSPLVDVGRLNPIVRAIVETQIRR